MLFIFFRFGWAFAAALRRIFSSFHSPQKLKIHLSFVFQWFLLFSGKICKGSPSVSISRVTLQLKACSLNIYSEIHQMDMMMSIYIFSMNLFLIFFLFFITVSVASESVTVLQGQSLEFSCQSSFPPPWNWYSSKEGTMKSLAFSGTKPHPKLNEPRYQFHKNGNEYFLRISQVEFSDAGKFICDADSRLTFVLNVLR